jgi:hypothetical protein
MHTIRQNHNKVGMPELLRVSGLDDLSSGSVQLHKQSFKLSFTSSMWDCRKFIVYSGWICAQRLPSTLHKSNYCKLRFDEITTVLHHTGDDAEVKRLFYTTLHSLMISQRGPQHVRFGVF